MMLRVTLFAGSLVIFASGASAHLELTSHESRYGGSEIKNGPCGRSGGTRGDFVYTAKPGTQVTFVWDEYIPHPGWFRIAFDNDGDDNFIEPHLACADPKDNVDLCFSKTTVGLDGLDNLFPHDATVNPIYNQAYTLPNVACTNCTLQVIQVMTDKPPYETPGNDLYYQCIDLILDPNGPDTLTLIPPPPGSGMVGNSSCQVGGGSGAALLLAFALLALRRRATA